MSDKVADFSLPATGDTTYTFSAQPAKAVVIYFYPKDNTPGCTTESAQFRDFHQSFQELGVQVVGVSRDSIKSHENFKAKLELPFPLLSDGEEALCTQFGVIKMKNMYGKQVRGIERSTFLVAADGTLLKEWRGVKVPGHVEAVLTAAKELVA